MTQENNTVFLFRWPSRTGRESDLNRKLNVSKRLSQIHQSAQHQLIEIVDTLISPQKGWSSTTSRKTNSQIIPANTREGMKPVARYYSSTKSRWTSRLPTGPLYRCGRSLLRSDRGGLVMLPQATTVNRPNNRIGCVRDYWWLLYKLFV